MDNKNQLTMKDEIIVDGIRYKRVDEEITLEDCVDKNTVAVGLLDPNGYAFYPTTEIAEKVLLYGLLQSVAYKLNGGKTGNWRIVRNIIDDKLYPRQGYSSVRFASESLALQAIRIFENSKFNLKKLFE
jgi:hypothetical protein